MPTDNGLLWLKIPNGYFGGWLASQNIFGVVCSPAFIQKTVATKFTVCHSQQRYFWSAFAFRTMITASNKLSMQKAYNCQWNFRKATFSLLTDLSNCKRFSERRDALILNLLARLYACAHPHNHCVPSPWQPHRHNPIIRLSIYWRHRSCSARHFRRIKSDDVPVRHRTLIGFHFEYAVNWKFFYFIIPSVVLTASSSQQILLTNQNASSSVSELAHVNDAISCVVNCWRASENILTGLLETSFMGEHTFNCSNTVMSNSGAEVVNEGFVQCLSIESCDSFNTIVADMNRAAVADRQTNNSTGSASSLKTRRVLRRTRAISSVAGKPMVLLREKKEARCVANESDWSKPRLQQKQQQQLASKLAQGQVDSSSLSSLEDDNGQNAPTRAEKCIVDDEPNEFVAMLANRWQHSRRSTPHQGSRAPLLAKAMRNSALPTRAHLADSQQDALERNSASDSDSGIPSCSSDGSDRWQKSRSAGDDCGALNDVDSFKNELYYLVDFATGEPIWKYECVAESCPTCKSPQPYFTNELNSSAPRITSKCDINDNLHDYGNMHHSGDSLMSIRLPEPCGTETSNHLTPSDHFYNQPSQCQISVTNTTATISDNFYQSPHVPICAFRQQMPVVPLFCTPELTTSQELVYHPQHYNLLTVTASACDDTFMLDASVAPCTNFYLDLTGYDVTISVEYPQLSNYPRPPSPPNCTFYSSTNTSSYLLSGDHKLSSQDGAADALFYFDVNNLSYSYLPEMLPPESFVSIPRPLCLPRSRDSLGTWKTCLIPSWCIENCKYFYDEYLIECTI